MFSLTTLVKSAKEARDLNEILFYLKNSSTKIEFDHKYDEVNKYNPHWASFKTDEAINSLKDEVYVALKDS